MLQLEGQVRAALPPALPEHTACTGTLRPNITVMSRTVCASLKRGWRREWSISHSDWLPETVEQVIPTPWVYPAVVVVPGSAAKMKV